jgi:hypothetical protein
MERHAPLERRAPLARGTGLRRDTPNTREAVRRNARRQVSPASAAQRAKVRHKACIRCDADGPCHPAHLIDRSLGGDDDPRAVVPLCPACHRDYDEGRCSLLEHLEPDYRAELAYAVELVGLLAALRRITNERYVPERS